MTLSNKSLRYRYMTTNLRGRPAYMKEEALLKELASGRQWRIDAVIDSIQEGDWEKMNARNLQKQAAIFGRLQATDRLCEILKCRKGHSPSVAFQFAVRHGHYKVAKKLLEHGAQGETLNLKYDVAFPAAVEEGSLKKIGTLLKSGANADRMLNHVIQSGHKKIADYLLKHGADINKADDGYWTPLMAAIRKRPDMVDYVLSKGAKPESNALYHAVHENDLALAEKLVRHGAKPQGTHLEEALRRGHLDIAEILVKNGVDIQGDNHAPLLISITSEKPKEAFEFCLKNGADPAAALAALKEDSGYFSMAGRDKMIAHLKAHVAVDMQQDAVEIKTPKPNF